MTYNMSSGTLNSTIPYPLDKVMVSARSGTVWAGQAYWYFFFDRLETIPPLLSDDCYT